MKNLNKSNDGMYHIKGGAKYEKLIGSRAQVWHGTAYKTSGGLTKTKLFKNKCGRIVSKNKHIQSSKEKRLLQYGYGYKKNKFVLNKKSKTKKLKGGNSENTEVMTDMADPSKKAESSGFFSFVNNIMPRFAGGKSRKRRGGGVASNAAPFKGGRSRRSRGGYNPSSGNAGVASQASPWHTKTMGNDSGPSLNLLATSYGGKRRSKRRKSRGGMYGQDSSNFLNSEHVNGIKTSSQDLNLFATNFSGGKRSKKRRSGRRRKSRGGMIYGPESNLAANAGSWNIKNGQDSGNPQEVATQYSD